MRTHDGRIWFESTVGVGTRFFVEFPTGVPATVEVEEPGVGVRPHGDAKPDHSTDRPRVLAIDDEPGILELLELAFEDDYEVVAVPSGAEALALLERGESFDAVLCDLMMPDIDGIAIHEYLERTRPELARCTIFLTGGAFSERSQRFLREADRRLIEKPFRFERISEEIEAVLKKADT
jgi:CheY-like chemotaxis protein